MLSHYNGYYWMEWYNGADSEGVKNRVLYASSRDAVTWSRPAVMFNATVKIDSYYFLSFVCCPSR